jgi:hypothetical protein
MLTGEGWPIAGQQECDAGWMHCASQAEPTRDAVSTSARSVLANAERKIVMGFTVPL